MVPRNIEDEIVELAPLGEVLLVVIDDLVCADRSDHVQFLSAIHAGHFCSERLGELHSEGTHPTTRPIDQDPLSCPYVSLIANALDCDESRGGDGRGLLKREVGRL